jgi:hypothetical protein
MKPQFIQLYLLGIVLTLSAVANAQVTFAPTNNYTVGYSPHSVVAVDVNGDGKVDLISANGGSGSLTVLTNNGFGVFGSNATYNVPSPASIVAADFNGDGQVDLACACGGGAIFVLTNNGSGYFKIDRYYSVGGNSQFVIAADVNGDGNMDLISGNNSSLVILTNTGNGNFVIASSPGVSAMSVTTADVNGDGKIDLIEANSHNLLMVLTNGGSGTFSLCSTSALYSTWPGQIATADVNGDGKLSIVVPDYSSSEGTTLEVLTNNGAGIFSSNATYTVGQGPQSVIATDINGDGKVDLITANLFGTLTVLTNNGSGGFGFCATLPTGLYPDSIVAADVNGDGKLDLVTASSGINALSVLINNSIFLPPISTPPLTINTAGNGMLVSWPAASAGWSLQQNPDITTPNWSPSGYSGYSISDDGTNKSLIISPPLGNLFFRLLHP